MGVERKNEKSMEEREIKKAEMRRNKWQIFVDTAHRRQNFVDRDACHPHTLGLHDILFLGYDDVKRFHHWVKILLMLQKLKEELYYCIVF